MRGDPSSSATPETQTRLKEQLASGSMVDGGDGALDAASVGALERRVTYELFILLVTLLSMTVALAQLLLPVPAEMAVVLARIDGIYVLVLLFDFARRLIWAPSKLRYLFGIGLFDLLGSIPALSILRFLRLPRVVWQVQLLRNGAPRGLVHAARTHLAQSTLLTVSFVVLLVILLGSLAIVGLEAGAANANILTGDDAIWWAIVTVATVGYGDRFPVSFGGRLVGTVMIVMGVSLFSVLTSYIASAFVARSESSTDEELAAVRTELAAVHRQLAVLTSQLGPRMAESDGRSAPPGSA